ncbi:hypothetical protein KKC83_02385 [Patescibacteria group bacterium]|nr:hypothetical protein [Candidatus Falkowbacteria bacterium]MBU3905988.1 hypothetical protein [Patescibacteria group bacterium]MCG2697559.1 hypothetical protein [Candidatus Parcubacteria bacterium]MBU4014775.1 hypothetical protein [Patescibacteria group bacterium]MBU4026364.1 hypothetical protein [Patescibacteria group bacterium]
MTKRIVLLTTLFLLTMAWLSGCVLLTPPPYVNQRMEIEKDEKGNVVKSSYNREVKGLAHEDPETVILEWAEAERMARGASYQTEGVHEGHEGIVRNDKYYYSYQVRIYRGDRSLWKISKDESKNLVASLAIDSRSKEKVTLPYSGDYTIVWIRNDQIKSCQKFNIKEGVIKKCMGEPCKWYSYMPR